MDDGFRVFEWRPDPQHKHQLSLWFNDECCRYYVRVRRRHCNFKQILDLTLAAPYCEDCRENDPFFVHEGSVPEIQHQSWQSDIAWQLGEDELKRVRKAVRRKEHIYYLCKGCGREFRPWESSSGDLFVCTYYLEEHFRFPLEEPGKINPSRQVRDKIFDLYGNKCFGCGTGSHPLHIDHILPRSRGGTAAFRNLQPLCEICGQRKGDIEPEEVGVIDHMFFGPYPSDGYEDIFWGVED